MPMPRKPVIRQVYQCQFSDCSYTWKTRRDSPPARCPNCQRLDWIHGDRTKLALEQALKNPPLAEPAPEEKAETNGEAA